MLSNRFDVLTDLESKTEIVDSEEQKYDQQAIFEVKT